MSNLISHPVRRRTLLKAGLAIGAMQVASPFVVKSLADEPVKIGLDNPLTGTFAALGKNELIGAQLALDQIKQCHWNVFRVCNTTRMETNSVSKLLLTSYGKKWYFITTDYAFGHSLQEGFEASLKEASGTELGADYTPLGTTDFSANLIKAQSTNPDAIILLLAGDDMINCLKQAVQFGLNQKIHIAGAQQELEVNKGLPPDALFGDWVFEWYWKQPGVPHVEQFVADIRKRANGNVPTARTWFGYAAIHTCKLAAEKAKSLDSVAMAKAMQGLELPPEVALMPNTPYYRKGDNQLMPTLFVGQSQPAPAGGDKEDLFKVTQLVKGDEAALSVEGTGCKMTWPA